MPKVTVRILPLRNLRGGGWGVAGEGFGGPGFPTGWKRGLMSVFPNPNKKRFLSCHL